MKLITIILLFEFLAGFVFGQKKDIPTFNIADQLKTSYNIQLSDIIADIKYIPLETNDKCLVGESPKVIPAGDSYLVNSEGTPLYLFDKTGKYIQTIGSIGKGPGEYGNHFTCFFDDKHQEILILSSRVLVYSLSGKFLRSWKPATRFYASLTMFDNNTTLADCPEQMRIGTQLCRSFVFDTLANISPLIIDKTEIQWKPEYEQAFSSTVRLGARYLYLPPRSDTLFVLNNKKLVPIALFQQGSNKMPDQYYLDSKLFSDARMKDYISGIYLVSMDDNKILMRVYYKGLPQIGILDLRKNELKFVKQRGTSDKDRGINNNFDGGLNLFPVSSLLCGEYCKAISAVDIIESYSNGFFKHRDYLHPEKNKSMLRVLNNLKEDDNPLIIRYFFK